MAALNILAQLELGAGWEGMIVTDREIGAKTIPATQDVEAVLVLANDGHGKALEIIGWPKSYHNRGAER